MDVHPLLEEKIVTQLKSLGVSFAPIVEAFRIDIDKRVGELHKALTENDLLESAALLHSLKGASLTLGARRLSDVCREMEFLAKDNETSAILERLNELQSVAQESVVALQKEFGSP